MSTFKDELTITEAYTSPGNVVASWSDSVLIAEAYTWGFIAKTWTISDQLQVNEFYYRNNYSAMWDDGLAISEQYWVGDYKTFSDKLINLEHYSQQVSKQLIDVIIFNSDRFSYSIDTTKILSDQLDISENYTYVPSR